MTTAVNEWLALLRVHEGGVTQLTATGQFLNQGWTVADYLATTFAELIGSGYLALGARGLDDSQRQVCLTHVGQLRYRALNGEQDARDR